MDETAGWLVWLLELVNGKKFDDFELFAAGWRSDLDFVADFAI